jgi:hypothetical protein
MYSAWLPRFFMLDGKFAYVINHFPASKTGLFIMSFQKVKKYHLSEAICRRAVRHP